MRKFLAQFGLTPMQQIDFEGFIFTQADKMLPAYSGGNWTTKSIGGVSILLLPVDEKQPVELVNYAFGGGITTDHLTASAAFTSCVVNWYFGLRGEQGRVSATAENAFIKFSNDMRDDVWADKPKHKINTRDYYSFTD